MSRLIALFCMVFALQAQAVLPDGALENAASPYLALHADDPVRWQPWSESTLALARELERPLFISSGFFACHWCHVMHRESFLDADVAARLNTYFVPVKIDREIDLALDDALFAFVRASEGIAGWPLNVVVTPQGQPWAGFVYLPRDDVLARLDALAVRWRDDPDAVRAGAGLPDEDEGDAPGEPRSKAALLERARAALLAEADVFEGGFGTQSRFPFPPRLAAALELFADDAEVAEFLELTLEMMADRGLRDHVGGGFFRYTEDPGWNMPHFEKMLADNAQLAQLYLDAGERFERPQWRALGFEALAFMQREMRRDDGLYVSALSAVDGRGEEGGHYLWSPLELGQALSGDTLRYAVEYFGLGRPPAYARGHLPVPYRSGAEVAHRLGLESETASVVAAGMRSDLRAARDARPALPVDDKAVLAWNGLVLSALARAAQDDPVWRAEASALATRLRAVSVRTPLPRALTPNGAPLGSALLEDHVLLARGLADWAAVSGGNADLEVAMHLAERAWAEFRDEAAGGWHTERAAVLRLSPARALLDGVHQPSPTAMFYQLARRFMHYDDRWNARANVLDAAIVRGFEARPLARIGHLVPPRDAGAR